MSFILTPPIRTTMLAESTVDGPRDGVSDPENEYMNTLPSLSDPTLEIPKSSFTLATTPQPPPQPISSSSPAESPSPAPLTPAAATAAPVAPANLGEIESVRSLYRNKAPRLAAAARASERKHAEAAAPPVAPASSLPVGGGWREVTPAEMKPATATAPPTKAVEIETKAEAAPAASERSQMEAKVKEMAVNAGAGAGVGGGVGMGEDWIEYPMDGMKILDLGRRERAWKGLAKRMYDKQPAFLERGKQRWNGLVEYDHKTDTVMWNKHSLPNSRLWKSTFDHGKGKKPNLGHTVLVLMEKNESKIIERMLASIIDDIDGFIILDTGSTDGTEQVMWDFLVTKHGKPGAIYRTEWYDFGTNRTITVQLAHQMGDWLLLMDADYRLEKENKAMPQLWKSQLPPLTTAPAWLLLKTTGSLDYSRPHLVRGCVRWCYVCRTHEYLSRSTHDTSTVNFHQMAFDPLKIDHVGDGCSKADKLGRDICLLLCDSLDDPKSERAPFYMANTLKEIQMWDWALRTYKTAMNSCGWNEENMCSAKGALECMIFKPHTSFERMLAMALHGMTQNPERLEIPSLFLRKIRTTREWWPKYSHLASSLGAFFTHNTYPGHQKLFIVRAEHDFGFWQECSICSFYNPQYFEFGYFMSQKIPTLPVFKQQDVQVQKQNLLNKSLYERKMDEWRKRGVYVTTPIRKYLLEQGHKAYAQHKFSKAKDWYQHLLHSVILQDLVPEHLLPTSTADGNGALGALAVAEGRRQVEELCDNVGSAMFHKYHRLTAWQSGKCLTPVHSEVDVDRALACFQMGQCQWKLNSGNDGIILAAMHYVDALKFIPSYPPALAALYELTILKPSDITRSILYLIRLVSTSPMSNASQPLLRNLKTTMEAMILDQSEWSHLVHLPQLLGTSWLLPIPPKPSTKPSPIRCQTNPQLPWMNHVQTSLLVTA